MMGIAGSAGSQGKVLIDGGQLNVNGTNAFLGVGNSGTGTLEIKNSGTVNANLGTGALSSIGSSALSGTSSATVVNVNAGTLALAAADRLADAAMAKRAAGSNRAQMSDYGQGD